MRITVARTRAYGLPTRCGKIKVCMNVKRTEILVEPVIFTALIAFLGSMLAAAFTYWSSKRREREGEWRKEKLQYYKSFIESLSGIIEGEDSLEGQRAFAKATNNLILLAPRAVIDALNDFRNEIRSSNPDNTLEKHDRFLATLLLAIRRDIGVSPIDDPNTFSPKLWASGAGKYSPSASRE